MHHITKPQPAVLTTNGLCVDVKGVVELYTWMACYAKSGDT